MKTTARDKSKNCGAALLLALGMLTILSVLGAAYVLSLQIDTESAALRLIKVRAAHAAEAGVQYALGEVLRAGDPASAAGERRYEIGVYGPVRTSPRTIEMTARLTNVKAYARVTVEPVSAADYPADAEGAAVAAKVGPGAGRLLRVTSEGVIARMDGGRNHGSTTARTVALLLLRPDGPQFVYWNSGPAPAGASKAR
jgi:Tfp pilus assembly protein PilX